MSFHKFKTLAVNEAIMSDSATITARHSPVRHAIKRALDIMVSVLALPFALLISIPVAIGVKLSSPGPLFFTQRRTGYKGREFTCLKFRSMRVNDESDTTQASNNDPRKTRFGEYLRRTSLDELPQLINVIKGDMSLIGPRPHMVAHTKQYAPVIKDYMSRHEMRPGITGWAQVNGFRGPTNELWMMEKRVEYDLWYVKHWSLRLDLKIFYRTILIILFGDKNAI